MITTRRKQSVTLTWSGREFEGLIMEINWVILGWIIDMTLNGFVWLIIVAFSLLLIDITDTWTRKAVKWMDKADKWVRVISIIQPKITQFISIIRPSNSRPDHVKP
jgi:hypothetical protein